MTTERFHPVTDETNKALVAELGKLVLLKEKELNADITQISDWAEVSALVKEGVAGDVFPVGTILHTPWTDVRDGNDTEWDFLWRVVHHGMATLKDGEVVPAMYLQAKHCLPFVTQFDEREAFYAAPAGGLAAGTYYINSGAGYQMMEPNTNYQFTLTQALPEGGQLIFKQSTYSTAPTTVSVYASGSATTATEECAVTVGNAGTLLGTLAVNPTATVNNIHRHVLGNNNFAKSALVQFLNSADAAGAWWQPKTPFDRPCTYAANTAGFLSGFEDDFVEHLAEALVKTAIPYCDGGTAQGTEATELFVKVFLPSAEQLDWVPTWYGIPYGLEGEVWEYWRRVYGSTPAAPGNTHTEFVMSAMGSETTMRSGFERSASRTNGASVASCYASGYVGRDYASYGYFAAPACCII